MYDEPSLVCSVSGHELSLNACVVRVHVFMCVICIYFCVCANLFTLKALVYVCP